MFPLTTEPASNTLVTVSSGAVLIALAVVVAALVITAAVRLALIGVSGGEDGDKVRSYVFLERYGAALALNGVGDRERRAAVRELRGNVAAAGAERGVSSAVEALGSPRALAAEVSSPRRSPLWFRGVLAGGLAVPAATYLHALLLDVWVTAAQEAGGASAHGSVGLLPGATFGFEEGGDFAIESVWLLLIPVAVFFFSARPWRVWTR